MKPDLVRWLTKRVISVRVPEPTARLESILAINPHYHFYNISFVGNHLSRKEDHDDVVVRRPQGLLDGMSQSRVGVLIGNQSKPGVGLATGSKPINSAIAWWPM